MPATARLGLRLPAISQATPVAPRYATTSRRERRRRAGESSIVIGILHLSSVPACRASPQGLAKHSRPARMIHEG